MKKAKTTILTKNSAKNLKVKNNIKAGEIAGESVDKNHKVTPWKKETDAYEKNNEEAEVFQKHDQEPQGEDRHQGRRTTNQRRMRSYGVLHSSLLTLKVAFFCHIA